MNHQVVSPEQWLEARRELLQKEKEFSKLRDELARSRRELPWVKVDKSYTFEGPEGTKTLSQLFADRSQLIVYHFMYSPDDDEGCKSCSLIADSYDSIELHLRARDVTLATVSKAPWQQLHAFRDRFGWSFQWFSSQGCDFNEDYQVSPSEGGLYNFSPVVDWDDERPGLSVFYKAEDGQIYHTYSVYARGLEDLMAVYRFLDVTPKGRDESELPYGMAWVRHRDRYGDDTFADPHLAQVEGCCSD
jgi:predicted dithiol-disulfide oxidoreductase (DUF899 family)